MARLIGFAATKHSVRAPIAEPDRRWSLAQRVEVALSQFRSRAYNFKVGVARPENIKLTADSCKRLV